MTGTQRFILAVLAIMALSEVAKSRGCDFTERQAPQGVRP